MESMDTSLYTLEQNMRLIDLAFDCVFLNSAEKEKTIRLFEEKSSEHHDITVIDIFRQEGFISEKRIEYLLAFDEHLQIQSRDQQFGMLATANGLATEENIYKALALQKQYFKKNKISMKIGDILIENKAITPSDRVSILLTQNRIKNENLLEAINHLGKTQSEKDAVNKRFGAIAIKKGLVTIEQVNAALDIQKKEIAQKGEIPFIGEILRETSDLTDTDLLEVLLEQKQFEKRRLDLEKALYSYKQEIRIFKKLSKLFEYKISKDGTKAFVKKIKETKDTIPNYEFLIWLRRIGIQFGIKDDTVLEEFIQRAEIKSRITIAKGYPAEPSVNGSIEFFFDNEFTHIRQDDSGPVETMETNDFIEENNLEGKEPRESEADPKEETENEERIGLGQDAAPFPVEKGSLLARIIPGKKGKPGKDVLGYPIHPDKPSISTLYAGTNVIQKEDVFFARIDGYPVLRGGTTLMVEPVVTKAKMTTLINPIDKDTKDKYESDIVELNADVCFGGVLRCASLVLNGNLMGQVICTGTIDVNGDIGRDEKPEENQTQVSCKGAMKAGKLIVNAKIHTDGELLAMNSRVVGSEVVACKGMKMKDCLGGKNGPSTLWFGLKTGDELLALDHTIEAKKDELRVLKKTDDINELTQGYQEDLKEEEIRETEQSILKNLMEIIEAPELYQYEGLEGKIRYLYGLPKHSSVKAYYLKIPETEAASAFLAQILRSTEKMTLDHVVKLIKKKIDPEPEDENAVSNRSKIETEFKARLKAFEHEVSEKSQEIENLESKINGYQVLREKLGSKYVNSLSRSMASIKIKNKCEKGTIIKGKIARLVLEKTLYNIQFKEVKGAKADDVSIMIESY